MTPFVAALFLLWLYALHRKLVRLAHQRRLHRARLAQAYLRRRSLADRLAIRLGEPPFPAPPPPRRRRADAGA